MPSALAPLSSPPDLRFPALNRGYARAFQPGRLSLGLVLPIEAYRQHRVPTLQRFVQRAQLADRLGFAALWLRDVPFDVPNFGDAGQVLDPFVCLGLLAGATQDIALGVASVVLPLRHPAHVAKAAASADQLSGGRVLLGIASGDRPDEYPALARPFDTRGEAFRAAYDYLRQVAAPKAAFDNPWGSPMGGMDLLPKPVAGRLPLLITGGSQQAPEWLASHGDAWMRYPHDPQLQAQVLADWRQRTRAACGHDKPAMQPLYVDLDPTPSTAPRPIHLGYRLGLHALRQHLHDLQAAGMNHVALNLRFQQGDVEQVLHTLADGLFPTFGAAPSA